MRRPLPSAVPSDAARRQSFPLRFLNNPRIRVALLALILIAATIAAYSPAMNGKFIWDDDVYITDNELLTAPDGLRRIWLSLDSPSQYFPLVYTTFRIEHSLWGLNPTGYHWVNLLLHVANALLVWRLLHRLQMPAAWFAAAIFALHPVHVESVAWITERKNVLMLLFFLLSLLAWVSFLDAGSARRRRTLFGAAIAFYMLSLFSKTTACTLPAALVLVLWWQHRPVTRARVLQIVPFFLIGLAMGLVTMWWERYHIGTRGELFSIGPVERLLVASHAVWFYAGKLVWPADLAFSYPKWTVSATDPAAWLWPAALAGAGAAIWFLRRRFGRGPEIAVVFFVATLSPMLGFIMLYTFRYTFVADHYQYAASIGLLALGAAALLRVLDQFGRARTIARITICGALLIALGTATWRHSAAYQNLEALWRSTISANPNSWLAHNNLGTELRSQGKVEEAIRHYERAVALESGYVEGHNNLANALLELQRLPEAIHHYRSALKANPNFAHAHYNLGIALTRQQLFAEALPHFERAVEILPRFPQAHSSIGDILLMEQRFEDAIRSYRTALSQNPAYFNAHLNLGTALLRSGDIHGASESYVNALRLRPDLPAMWQNLRSAIWIMATSDDPAVRDGPKAVELAELLIRTSGQNDIFVLRALAAAYAEAGNFPEAMDTARRSLERATAEGNSEATALLQRDLANYQAGRTLRDNTDGR